MKFALISDVHVDITAWDPDRLSKAAPNCNTIVVAGDISNDIWITCKWIANLKSSFANVIWVSGNHDFYNTGFHRTRIFNPDIEKQYPAERPGAPFAGDEAGQEIEIECEGEKN